jgi:hypothetical protein
MERYDPGYIKLARPDGSLPEIGFEGDAGRGERRPRWPDPAYPQQLHFDIEVGDLDMGEAVALRLGATRLQDNGEYRVFADPVGHPFCLYLDLALRHRQERPLPGRIARIVFDCFSPRALARFFAELLNMPRRVLDSPERVVIAGSADGELLLAFQHAQFPAARWPDPANPAQLHLDLSFDDLEAGLALAEQLGAIRLATFPMHTVYADPDSHPFCVGMPAPPEWRAEHWAKRPASGAGQR